MSDNNAKQRKPLQQFAAVFLRMVSTGRKVAAEDAARAVTTDDGFDRRAFGPIVAGFHRDGLIEPAGFRESVNAKHHCGVKRLWVSTNKKREAGT